MPQISLADAYATCRNIAGHYENFPVGSVLIPKRYRKHFYALYAFMRKADDFADEPERSSKERLDLLAGWRSKLDGILAGDSPDDPVFLALADTIAECTLPSGALYRLLDAFEFDARGEARFETFDDLRWYTSRSAEPVGELVLAVFGIRNEQLIALSNEICTGLQLLNFIQDIRDDLEHGRFYYPHEDWLTFGMEPSAKPEKDRIALLSLFELERVESLIDRGAPLAEAVGGRLTLELRAVVHAARRMIHKIEFLDGRTYERRPHLTKGEHLSVILQSILVRAS